MGLFVFKWIHDDVPGAGVRSERVGVNGFNDDDIKRRRGGVGSAGANRVSQSVRMYTMTTTVVVSAMAFNEDGRDGDRGVEGEDGRTTTVPK